MATKLSTPLASFWAGHINRWKTTQQSQIACCRDQKLNYHRFTYWHRKFKSTRQAIPAQSGFVPVKAILPAAATYGLTAILPNGVMLQGIADDNLSIVKQLLGLKS